MHFTLTERTLYKPLSNFLSSLGCDAVEEVQVFGYPDLLASFKDSQFVIQVKIGEQGLVDGITQIERHARGVGTDQKILLVYPEQARVKFVSPDDKRVSRIALTLPLIHGIVLTNSLTENFKGKGADYVLRELVKSIDKKTKTYRPEIAVDTLTESVQLLANELRRWDEVAKLENEVVGRMELFTALGADGKIDKKEFRAAAIDLSAYILINQLLFYRIFSEKTGRVAALDDFENKNDLVRRFAQILKIDFVPIFRVDILNLIPEKPEIKFIIKQIVLALSALRPEEMEHDLPGRIFHDLIPHATRKLLAAFYTRPVAAELIAGLTIKTGHDKVIDPACGSGTLLVSAYWRKMRLSHAGEPNLHKRFLETEITGVDIMPFASHLTAVNLAAQNVEEITNNLRIGCYDSLKIKAGSILSPSDWQLSLLESDVRPNKVNVVESKTVDNFDIGLVDAVIMNPPFTKQERLPNDYHKKVLSRWGKLTGGRVGLWGPFIFLGNEILKKNGRIGMIIPINILRGEETRSIREFLTRGNFTWRYILRGAKNYAFSESSEYSDIILILEKARPKTKDKVGVVLIQKDLGKLTFQEARMISSRIPAINSGSEHREELFEIYWEEHSWLDKHIGNMMPLVSMGTIKNKKRADAFLKPFLTSKKTKQLPAECFSEGFRPVPAGLSDLVFITKAESNERAMYANLILKEENKLEVTGLSKSGTKVIIPRKYILDSLRTPVGLSKMDISEELDYLIIAPYKELNILKNLSSFTGELNWDEITKTALKTKTNIVICRRINPYSPSQSHIAFFSETPFYPSNQLEVVHLEEEEAKIMCLFFNSTLFFTQFLLNKEESTGRRVDIRVSDLASMRSFDYRLLTETDKKLLLKTFEQVSEKKFPSLMEQYKNCFELKKVIDEAVLSVAGLKANTIKTLLPNIYETLYEEMVRIRSFARD